MVHIQRTLQILFYSAGSNIFWELGYQDTQLFPGLCYIWGKKTRKSNFDSLKYGIFGEYTEQIFVLQSTVI